MRDQVRCERCHGTLAYEDADGGGGDYYHPECYREEQPECINCGQRIGVRDETHYNLSGDLVHAACPKRR